MSVKARVQCAIFGLLFVIAWWPPKDRTALFLWACGVGYLVAACWWPEPKPKTADEEYAEQLKALGIRPPPK